MRSLTIAMLTAGALFAAGGAHAQTYAPGYPVCLHVYGPVNYYDCSFTSIAQCNLSASARAADCELNPYMARAAVVQPRARQYRPY